MSKSKGSAKRITAVDLFCGVGGLTHGLRKAGVSVVAGYDVDGACEWPYEANNGEGTFHKVDVAALDADSVRKHYAKSKGVSLLAGCAPCQPFSTYSLNKTDEKDDRWSMLDHFSRLIVDVKPTLVTMENVPQLKKHPVFKEFINSLKKNGYFTSTHIVHCEEYGVPQARRRLVVLASQLGEISLRDRDPRRDKRRTVRHSIGRLTPINAGVACAKDLLHRSSTLSEINIKRIHEAKPGGTWRDWDPELVAPCHRQKSGKTFPGVYGRMEWDRPSPTITTQFYAFGSGRFGHPEQHRGLSLREGAMLQTFPSRYRFVERGQKVHMKVLGRLIGNAVPVRLGQVIGESLIDHVKAMRR